MSSSVVLKSFIFAFIVSSRSQEHYHEGGKTDSIMAEALKSEARGLWFDTRVAQQNYRQLSGVGTKLHRGLEGEMRY